MIKSSFRRSYAEYLHLECFSKLDTNNLLDIDSTQPLTMTKFPKSVLEERRAASLKLLEAIDAYEKAEHGEDSVSVMIRWIVKAPH